MAEIKDLFQTADWNKEKHVPVIDSPAAVARGASFKVSVSVGKAIPHPNTTEHHIRWITVFFLPDGGKFPYQVGRAEFAAHGESAEGPNTSGVYTGPDTDFILKLDKAGVLMASSYCNIHGLWQSSKKVEVQ